MEEDAYTWSGDGKHVEKLITELGLTGANPVSVPVVREDQPDDDGDERDEMDAAEATRYRRGAARVNYLALDRPDLGFAANMLSRSMAKPRRGDESLLKRVARYLILHPRVVIRYGDQPVPAQVTVMTDSDWGGCRRTRRSTTGTAVMWGNHLLTLPAECKRPSA